MGSFSSNGTNNKKQTTKRRGTLVRVSTGEKIQYNSDPERSKPKVTEKQKQEAETRYQQYRSAAKKNDDRELGKPWDNTGDVVDSTTGTVINVPEKNHGNGYSPLKTVGGIVQRGLSQIAQAGGNTLAFAEDVLLRPIEWVSGLEAGQLSDDAPFNTWAEAIRKESDAVNAYYAENSAKGGKIAQTVEDLGAATVAAAPQAIMAFLSGGGSAIASTTAGLTQTATSAISPSLMNTVRNAVTGMAKDPQYWASFAQVVGDSYEQALADGADREKATLYALGNSVLNAAVEVGGGIQTLPGELQQGGSALRAWIDSMVDEGKEEVVQGIIERAAQNAVYNKGNPIASTTDENAIFNPYTAGKEFAGGAVVGGILSGAQIGVVKGINYLANRANQKQAQPTTVETAPEAAQESAVQDQEAPTITPEEYAKAVADAQMPQEVAQETVEAKDSDNRDDIDPAAIRKEQEKRGIVNGKVVDQEALDNDPFIQRVTSDTERISDAALETKADTTIEDTPEATAEAPKGAEVPTSTTTEPVTLESVAKKYGKQAEAVQRTYNEGQDVQKFADAYDYAWSVGKGGGYLEDVMNSPVTNYLTGQQIRLAYQAGVAASKAAAGELASNIKPNGMTGRRKGTVKGEGVTIADLKATFNDRQGQAFKALSTITEVTGIDIVLYKSEAANGKFEGSQGKFKWSDDKIYIDVNAGLYYAKDVTELSKYTMLRTFTHEFTHFIEKWNPQEYNDLRQVVFDTLKANGENVQDLIETKMAMDESLTYDRASREVVAEGLSDILPDSSFIQTLAEQHQNIFQKIHEKLKEFAAQLREHFNSLVKNPSREANALKVGDTLNYVDSVVKMFDKVSTQAVENYQGANAVEEKTAETYTSKNGYTITDNPEYHSIEIKFDGKPAEEVRNALKGNKFRWNGKKGVWYGKTDRQTIIDALDKAYTQKPEMTFEESFKNASREEKDEVLKALDENLGKPGRVFPTEIREAVVNKEETNNGTEIDQRGVLEPDTSGQGAARLLDAVEETPVQGDGGQREAVPVSEERGNKAERPDHRADAGWDGRGRSLGSGEVADVRRDDGLSGQEKTDTAAPVYETAERKPTTEDVEERKRLMVERKKTMKEAAKKYGVTDKEASVLDNYVGGSLCYMLNLRARNGNLSAEDRGILETIVSALKKFPQYSGRTYRNLKFKTQEQYDDFIQKHKPGDTVTFDGLTSTSKLPNGYVKVGDGVVHMVIDGVSGYDIADTFGQKKQQEVLYLPGTKFEITDVTTANDGNPLIYAKEIASNGTLENEDGAGHGDQGPAQSDGGNGTVGSQREPRLDGAVRSDESVPDEARGGRGRDDVRRERGESSDGGNVPLRDEVTEQIERTSTVQPKGQNFVIGDSLDLPKGEKARYKANVEAIRIVKQLEADGRVATPAEQEALSKYVGWGGLANAFDAKKADWSKEYAELKDLLTDEEYAAARASTLNAHYTDISVIKAMYDGLKQLGFTGGRMLEPASGVGNFVGAMPADMAATVKSWTMVELDSITGLIAKHLYPNADVRIQGFEKANLPDNYMDVAISNVPFGNFAIVDKAFPKAVTSAIHNYFFAKALAKVRTGGIVMFITSSYTMNSKDSAVRRYIMKQADLLGAIRLPESAFKGNANTEVVTDILVLKKRAALTEYAGEAFQEAPYQYIQGYNGAYINEYFTNHPEMVLGTASMDGSMYRGNSLTYKPFTDRGSLADQIREAFKHIQGKMDYPATLSKERTNFAVERETKKGKNGGLVSKDGKIYKNTNGELVEQTVESADAECITSMLAIRDAHRDLANFLQQGLNDKTIKAARKKLNQLYDGFVKKYGYLNEAKNKKLLDEDPDQYSILSLENFSQKLETGKNGKRHWVKTASKADIFTKDTIAPNRTITSVKDVSEGLIVSRNETGGVDVAMIAKLTGKSAEDVTRELIDSRMVFKTKDGGLEPAETYLSGNVRAKLREAEALAPMDKDFQNNVEALRPIIPEDVPYTDIFCNPGATWIPDSVYSDFAAEMLGSRNSEWSPVVTIKRMPETGNFTVELKNKWLKTNANNTQRWGTPQRSFLNLFDAMLNSRSVVIRYKTEDGSSVVDKDATAAANEKIENIKKEFQEWLWKDEARKTELASLYNETFNAIVNTRYNGDNLTVNGANAMKPLRPHQRDAVQRIISSGGNTLLAHKVGAGKTYEMAAAAMKLKQLGIVKKPMFIVPKSLVSQWGKEFKDFFPTAKLLVADDKSFSPANRKINANRIANNNYDAVIVSYEQFEKIPMSADFQAQFYQEQIDDVIRAIEEEREASGKNSLSIKDLEKKRKKLQNKLEKLTSKEKDEDSIEFEQLGVDSLFVDEAHNFKNLEYTTSMSNVAGLGNKDGSGRAFDLYTKVRYLQGLNGGRGIVFATATPVMNSMSEMYIMQRYLQPDLLNQIGLNTFDAWAKQFGEVVNGVEIKPSGQGYRVKQSFSRFKNMNELQLLFRNFADVLTSIPGLKIPKIKGGKVNVVVCEPGEFQKNYMLELEKRADNVKNVDPSVDNMLKITSDGRKVAYTQRMIDPSLPYEDGCKIYRCCDNIVSKYKESKNIKGTQLVFLDMATPKGKSSKETDVESGADVESAQLYDDIRARLVKLGIPKGEIAFIHEADTDAKKKELFQDVNDGTVRVLIGSTGKMGVGMNAQKRVVAIHHLDAPWRPGDVEQRNGRAFRQGNINDEVECFTYVTEGSFDARLWDILDRKQNFINQIMNGENVGRETEDTGEVTLSAAEVKALASGSPLILEQVQLDTDIKKLESLQRAHSSSVNRAKSYLTQDEAKIASLEKTIENGKADLASRVDTYSDDKFSMTVGRQKFTDKKEAGAALMAAITAKAGEEYTAVGKFAGFELKVRKTDAEYTGLISGKNGYPFRVYSTETTRMVTNMCSTVFNMPDTIKGWETNLEETRKDLEEQKNLIAEPFTKQTELDQKRKRYNEVMEILNPKEEQSLDSIEEEEQSREYLLEEEQTRQQSYTDREVLAIAAEDVSVDGLNAGEQDALRIFKNRLNTLEDLQVKRQEQGRKYKEQQFGEKVDRAEAEKTLNRMKVLDTQIERASQDVLKVEETEVLRRVLKKARTVVENQEREHGKELLARYRDRRANAATIKKYRERLKTDVDSLAKWIVHPNNKDVIQHIPDTIKNAVIPFLNSIDFTSKRQLNGGDATKADAEFVKRVKTLNAALKENINVQGLYSGYNDLPPYFMERLQGFVDTVQDLVDKNTGDFVVNRMTGEELRNLSEIVRVLKTTIINMNKFHANAMFQHVYEAGEDSMTHMEEFKNAGKENGVSNFFLWQQMRPAYGFERFGKGGKAVWDGLRRGQAKLAFNAEEIKQFAENAYSADEVKAWEKETKTFTLGNDTVTIPVSYIMSLYELSKRPQAMGHLMGEGIRVATFKNGKEKVSDVGHKLTKGDLETIINSLSDRQKEVADELQKYMADQGGKWGNYVSMARFGEELFGEEHYFPINSDGRQLSANADEAPSNASLYALLNMSFTKELNEEATNRLVLYSVFDVFSNHMSSMAQYNAMALPVLDAIKWFNYTRTELIDGAKVRMGSVRDEMNRAFGVPEESKPGSGKKGYAESFVMNILKGFNGTEAQGVPEDTPLISMLHRYNAAQVAFNARVAFLQPLAITRAAMILDYASIMRGVSDVANLKKNIQEMKKYSGIAAWKDLGFYDVNISRGLNAIIKHDDTIPERVLEVGTKGAEWGDRVTWAAIWSACKTQVAKRMNPSAKGYYEAVSDLFEEVIYKTQVVDSIIAKNQFLRSKSFGARSFGSFMNEPSTTASMLTNAYDQYNMDLKRGMNKTQAWQKNRQLIVRTTYVYAITAILTAAIESIPDAWRDDDDYETGLEKWWEAMKGNLVDELMPFNKLPIMSDLYNVVKSILEKVGVDTYGFEPNTFYSQLYNYIVKGTEIIYDKITGADTNYTWYGGAYKLLQAASGLSGLPMSAVTREVVTLWNNSVGTMAPSLKAKTYDPGDKAEIKYAYQDGYLTAEEATAQLMEKGLVEDKNDAYWAIQKWDSGDASYSRYDKLYDAAKNGGSINTPMRELTSHGYTEKDVISQLKSQIGKWYKEGESTRSEAIRMLTRYCGMTRDEATEKIKKYDEEKK